MDSRTDAPTDPVVTVDLTAPLFVPGDRPDRITKAAERASTIIVDLEDAVAEASKTKARDDAAQALARRRADTTYLVRINSVEETASFEADVTALAGVMNLIDGLVVPKVSSPAQVRHVRSAVAAAGSRCPLLIPTVETAAGILDARAIASETGVHTLLFGPIDLSAQLGTPVSVDGMELLTARSLTVLGCAAAGVAAPIDGPWPVIDEIDALLASSQHCRGLGFGGRIAIHPGQVPTIEQAFAPDPDEVAWAREVVRVYTDSVAAGIGAIALEDGTFIDPPVMDRAQSILRRVDR